ncbi:protein MALE DISCOVERER 2 isoform X2 [Gossypium hirsutum]|uniref:Protein MALE DISCOVERER 2 isoform X2 n=1 Tax=Gossypium hirsutum TaxID=3635 RepID=A0ABM3BZ59_GOSHI|nr:protein MALE DISCOVERER 2 isoform X2 [Gossypium hirsutum]
MIKSHCYHCNNNIRDPMKIKRRNLSYMQLSRRRVLGRGAFCMRKISSFFVEAGCLPLQRLVYVAMGGKWNHIEFHFLLFFLIPCFIIQGSLAIITDGLALLEFRARIDSDPCGAFANWNSNDTTPCMWYGVHCVDGKVQMLVLYRNRFSGVIPKEFGELTKLELLDLRENDLSGMVPAEIGEMSSLKCLLLYDNKFEGKIPSEFGKLKLLSELQFYKNLASILATRIGCANRKFRLRIWQSSWRQFNGGSFLIQIQGAVIRSLNTVLIQWFKLQKDTLAGCNDSCCGSSEQQMACNARNLVVPFERRGLLGSSKNLPAVPATAVPSTEQIIALPTTRSSGSFPAVPKETGTKSEPDDESSETNLEPADQSSQADSKPVDQSSETSKGETTAEKFSGDLWKYFIIIPCILVFIAFVALAFMCRKRAAKAIGPWKTGLSGQLQKVFVTGVPKLNRSELETACEDFSNIVQAIDGCTVYKGTLSSGVEIAVTSICVSSSKEWPKSSETGFRRKIDRLSRINHKNFVNLIGYCMDDEPFSRMMVFEYTPNGTLFEHLHVEDMEHLDWSGRVRIIMGVAYCLLYMHHDLNPPISHPNLSSSFIYLTDDYAAKISEILGFDSATKSNNSVDDGSQDSKLDPYADPETNVYSFGILLLEIVSGKLVYSKEQGSIEEWASQYLNDKGSLNNLVDPTLKGYKAEELEVICEVIQECIQSEPRQRPTMKDVSSKLRQAFNITPEQAVPRLSPLWWAELEILSMETL